ncbi:MAG TPA: hypothetical protein VGR48_07220 [Terriglobales bacterium]|nr:hypothetical protein [Terriglobales bacterium]
MTPEQKATTRVYFDLDYISEQHTAIFTADYNCIDHDLFTQTVTKLAAESSHEELFSKLDVDTFHGETEPTLETSDFTTEELRNLFIRDMLRMWDEELADNGGHIFTCVGQPWEGPHMLENMRDLVADPDERWFVLYYDFAEDDGQVTLDEMRERSGLFSHRWLNNLLTDDDTWCVRQVCYLPERVAGLSIEHGGDGYTMAIPESEIAKVKVITGAVVEK